MDTQNIKKCRYIPEKMWIFPARDYVGISIVQASGITKTNIVQASGTTKTNIVNVLRREVSYPFLHRIMSILDR